MRAFYYIANMAGFGKKTKPGFKDFIVNDCNDAQVRKYLEGMDALSVMEDWSQRKTISADTTEEKNESAVKNYQQVVADVQLPVNPKIILGNNKFCWDEQAKRYTRQSVAVLTAASMNNFSVFPGKGASYV